MGGIDANSSADPADIPDAMPYVVAALDGLAAGRSVAPPITRAYGCTIKC